LDGFLRFVFNPFIQKADSSEDGGHQQYGENQEDKDQQPLGDVDMHVRLFVLYRALQVSVGTEGLFS